MDQPPDPMSPPSPRPLPPPPLDDAIPPLSAKRTPRHGRIKYRRMYLDEPECEDVQRYRPGGFHPVDIGDKIDRYTVLHKLGSGGFAMVWLVQSSEDGRYFALKILCAYASGTKANEQHILEHLGPHDHPNVVKLIRAFEVTGPNGVHTCLVLPVCGPSLFNWSLGRTFTHGARYYIVQQVASGVAFLHERGVAHTDLTTSNVVFRLPDIQSMSPDAVLQLFGPIVKERLKLHDGSYSPHGPKRIIKNPDFSGFNIQMSSAGVMIIDLGEAFVLGRPRSGTGLGIPISSFPPEVCFGIPPSAGSDVWELACLFFDVFCCRPLFPMFWPVFEILIHHIVHSVGLLPQSWRGHFDANRYSTIEKGEFLSTTEGTYFWFEEKPEDGRGSLRDELLQAAPRSELTTEQQEFIASLLQEMMAREPEERLPARDVLGRLESAAPLFGGEVAEHPERIAENTHGYEDAAAPPPPAPPSLPEYDDSDSE